MFNKKKLKKNKNLHTFIQKKKKIIASMFDTIHQQIIHLVRGSDTSDAICVTHVYWRYDTQL